MVQDEDDDIHNLEDAPEDIPTIIPPVPNPLRVAKQGSSLKKQEGTLKKKSILKVGFSVPENSIPSELKRTVTHAVEVKKPFFPAMLKSTKNNNPKRKLKGTLSKELT